MLTALVFFVVIVTGNCELLLTTTPSSILPGVTTNLAVRCSLGPNSEEVNRVMVMQIEKVNGIHIRPLASMTTGEDAKLDTQFPAGKATVTGMLTSDPKACYIELSLNDPNEEDSGHYLCVMSVLDKSFLLERLDVQGYVNMTSPDDEDATQLLIHELKNLQGQVEELSRTCQSSCGGPSLPPGSDHQRGTFVAFTAYPSTRRLYHTGSPLLFDNAVVNVGHAYNPVLSTFTAPVNGTYVFMASVSMDHFKTITELKLNGLTVAQMATVDDDQASNSVVLNLVHGDTLWLEGVYRSSNSNITMYSDKDTLFSGYLLHEF